MSKVTTAIEIKRDVLRVLQLKKGIKEFYLVDCKEEKLPFVPSLDIKENVELVSSKIKLLLQSLPLKVKKPIFIIPTSEIMVRFFDLPYLGKKERGEAIKYEAQKYIPFPIDDIASDYYIPYEIKGKEMRVVYMAVKNEMLDTYIRIAENIGCKLSAIEPYPFSLLRALFASGDLKLTNFVLVVDLDYSSSTILVTQGLNLYIARDFILPAITESTASEILNRIVFEINRTIDYIIKEFPHQPIKEIILTGELVNEELRDSLMSMLDLGVKLSSLDAKIKTENSDALRKYTGLLGAGLRDLVSSDIDLDFFADYQNKGSVIARLSFKDFLPRQLWQDMILLLAGFIITASYLKYQTASIKDMSNSTALPSAIINKSEKDIKKETKTIEAQLSFYKELLEQKVYITKLLNFMPQKVSLGVWLENIDLKKSRNGETEIIIAGYGYDSENKGIDLIYDFLEKINASKEARELFQDVKITNVEKADISGYKVVRFAMRMVLK